MNYDYGTVYEMGTIDPLNSRAYLSRLPTTGTVALNINTPSSLYVSTSNFAEDDYIINEFATVKRGGGGVNNSLHIYDVHQGNSTGTTSFTFTNSVSIPTLAFKTISGIRRVNDNLFYLYHIDAEWSGVSNYSDLSLQIRRYSAIPSGTSVDVTLETLNFELPALPLSTILGYISLVSERKIYYTVVQSHGSGVGNTKQVDLTVCCIDMENDLTTQVFTHSTPLLGADSYYLSARPVITISYGNLDYYVLYSIVTNATGHISYYLNLGGSITTLANLNEDGSAIALPASYRYNYRDHKQILLLEDTDPTKYYVVIDSVSGITISNSDSTYPDTTPITFSSLGKFPKIGFYSGTYQWLDPYGKRTGEVLLSGVSHIYTIYPTLDSLNGNMYVTALMDDTTQKLLEVDPENGTIYDQKFISALPFTNYAGTINFNIGNFFMTYNGVYQVSYLADVFPVVGVGDSQMLEKN